MATSFTEITKTMEDENIHRFLLSKKKSVKEAFLQYFMDKNFPITKLTEDQIARLIFEDFLTFIKVNHWSYAFSHTEKLRNKSVIYANSAQPHIVNCYDLCKAFKNLLTIFNINNIVIVEYTFEYSKEMNKKYKDVQGPFTCFDEKAMSRFQPFNNCFLFKKHAVVKVNNTYYDLTFQCFYEEKYAIFDKSPIKELFREAMLNNSEKFIEKFNSIKIDINHIDEFHWTLLHCFALNQNFAMVKFLIEKGANPNMFDYKGKYPLHLIKIFELKHYLEKHMNPDIVSEIRKVNKTMDNTKDNAKINITEIEKAVLFSEANSLSSSKTTSVIKTPMIINNEMEIDTIKNRSNYKESILKI